MPPTGLEPVLLSEEGLKPTAATDYAMVAGVPQAAAGLEATILSEMALETIAATDDAMVSMAGGAAWVM